MKARAYAAWLGIMLLAVAVTGVSSAKLYAAPTTYGGVTFPQGDLAFADRVVDYLAASCVRDAYDDPIEALGPPDACGDGCDGCHGCTTNAVSLGFRLSALDHRGYLIVAFVDNVLADVPGDDLFIYNTNGHPARVEISTDGLNFIFVGETVGYPGSIDIAPFVVDGDTFAYVRLSDVPADEDHTECSGPSIDAIGAMGHAQIIPEGSSFGSLTLEPIGELSLSLERASSSLLIILDASSSMSEFLNGDRKITVAKDVIIDLIDNLPDESLVGMRTFSGCDNSPVIAPVGPLDRESLKKAVDLIVPRALTPIAYALNQARDDLLNIPDPKLILLVSDGKETCGGDPVEAAMDLIAAGYDLRIHVVGFDIGEDQGARQQLREIAQVTGGIYYDARNSEELRNALAVAAPFSYSVYDEFGTLLYSGRIGDSGPPSLAAGSYRVVIDATPPIVLENVMIAPDGTTTIKVEQANGAFRAEVENP